MPRPAEGEGEGGRGKRWVGDRGTDGWKSGMSVGVEKREKRGERTDDELHVIVESHVEPRSFLRQLQEREGSQETPTSAGKQGTERAGSAERPACAPDLSPCP